MNEVNKNSQIIITFTLHTFNNEIYCPVDSIREYRKLSVQEKVYIEQFSVLRILKKKNCSGLFKKKHRPKDFFVKKV